MVPVSTIPTTTSLLSVPKLAHAACALIFCMFHWFGAELASQYALGYTSKNPRRDGRFRKVTVRVADHPGAAPRTRSGYVAARADRKAAAE